MSYIDSDTMNASFHPAGCTLQPSFRGNLQRNRVNRPTVLFSILTLAMWVAVLPARAMGPTRMHEGETQHGMASWYGVEQGRHTASGERFNPHALTAAHKHLPFGTIVRVTNELNGCCVDVRINDRGPWRHGRIIDVTDEAANILQMKKLGTVPVTITIIKLGPPSKHAQG
jgi:rare lipoprotein A (peptidoglycan hydrolase)